MISMRVLGWAIGIVLVIVLIAAIVITFIGV